MSRRLAPTETTDIIKSPTTEGSETAYDRIKEFSAPRTKRLLVVEDDDVERRSVPELKWARGVIDDLLDVSRISRGKIEPKRDPGGGRVQPPADRSARARIDR